MYRGTGAHVSSGGFEEKTYKLSLLRINRESALALLAGIARLVPHHAANRVIASSIWRALLAHFIDVCTMRTRWSRR